MIFNNKRFVEMTEPELREFFDAATLEIELMLPRGCVFALAVVDEQGVAQYASNGRRPEMIALFRACADRVEANRTIPR